jgi:hypothetical protein
LRYVQRLEQPSAFAFFFYNVYIFAVNLSGSSEEIALRSFYTSDSNMGIAAWRH